MSNTWVDNIDKAVGALTYQIEQLKTKAEANIPSVMKLNKITTPVMANKQAVYAFKIGSSYYERDPETIELVETKLAQLLAELAKEKEKVIAEHETNIAAIENNQAIHVKVKQIMKDLGIPNNWSRSYFKTASSRKQTVETNAAGYIGDLNRNIPVSDESGRILSLITQAETRFKEYAKTLIQKIRTAQAEKEKIETAKKSTLALVRMQVKYGLTEDSDWSDVEDALQSKCKYFKLASAMEAVRNDWNDGFGPVQWAISDFEVVTPEDEEIYEEIHNLSYESDERDGRCFRDCQYNYSVLYAKVDAELMQDFETLRTYYDRY
jgi:Holliday junction resolvasome RuvABC endonuclease subunit